MTAGFSADAIPFRQAPAGVTGAQEVALAGAHPPEADAGGIGCRQLFIAPLHLLCQGSHLMLQRGTPAGRLKDRRMC